MAEGHNQLETKACKPMGVSLAPLSPRSLASTELGFEASRLVWGSLVCLAGNKFDSGMWGKFWSLQNSLVLGPATVMSKEDKIIT